MLKLSYSDLKDMFPPRQNNKNIYEHGKQKIIRQAIATRSAKRLLIMKIKYVLKYSKGFSQIAQVYQTF